MSGNHVTSKDHGANAMLAAMLRMAKGAELKVGVLASGHAGDHEDGGITVAEVATINEFGAPEAGIPERSFIRAWYDDNLEGNKAKLRAIQARVVRGEITQEQGFAQLGELFKGDIQKRIVAGIPPENAQSTIDAKGSSTPLINHGQLKNSISYEVIV